MGGRDVSCLTCFLFTLLLSSGSGDASVKGPRRTNKESLGQKEKPQIPPRRMQAFGKDVTNPVTTVPLINLTLPNSATPLATASSILPPATTTMAPAAISSPSSSDSWCVASQSVPEKALQVGLDYACGHGSDCSSIQPNGMCYEPNTVRDHASFAFNNFYQKNPVPNSCNFAGTAVITSTDPSSGKCHYSSISTTSSILNTTNQSGSTVFGAQPSTSSGSAATVSGGFPFLLILTLLVMWLRGFR